MGNQTAITSLQNPRVKALVKLREHRGRRQADLFVAEGMRAIERAIAAELRIESIWVCEERFSNTRDLSLGPDIEIVSVPAAVFNKVAYVREPEGILAVCRPPSWSVDALPTPDRSTLDFVAVGTEKPGNLGAMVRTADLAGCRSVIAAGTPIDAMNPNAIRASTGSVFTVPTINLTEEEAIAYLVNQHIRILAAVIDGQIPHTQADYSGPCAVVIGPEDRGLSEPWRAAAKQTSGATVTIPMAGRSADSLNASVAAGVLLFEAVRQQKTSGLQ